MTARNYFPIEPPYGLHNLMKPKAVMEGLGIGHDSLRRMRPDLHRLELKNGSRLFPTDFIGGLIDLADAAPTARMLDISRHYAGTEEVWAHVEEAETGFEQALQAALRGEKDERLIGTAAIARLLGYRRETVTSWALQSRVLVPVTANFQGIPDLWVPESNFREFYEWQRPGTDQPDPTTA